MHTCFKKNQMENENEMSSWFCSNLQLSSNAMSLFSKKKPKFRHLEVQGSAGRNRNRLKPTLAAQGLWNQILGFGSPILQPIHPRHHERFRAQSFFSLFWADRTLSQVGSRLGATESRFELAYTISYISLYLLVAFKIYIYI